MKLCVIKGCNRPEAATKRGLCLICYGQAKRKVESGETTWDRLVELGLVEPEENPFNSAYEKAMGDEADHHHEEDIPL